MFVCHRGQFEYVRVPFGLSNAPGHFQSVMNHVNTFILVTWGTDLIEGCLDCKSITLTAGTYLIHWSGNCALCTKYHCVQGIKQSYPKLRLKNTWRAIKIPNTMNFSHVNIGVKLPAVAAELPVMALEQIDSQDAPDIIWSHQSTILIDFIIFTILIAVCAFALYYFKYVKCADNRNTRELEQAESLHSVL